MSLHDRLNHGIIPVSTGKPTPLPLKAVDFRFKISGGAVYVQIEQIFLQTHDAPIDCLYTFPLPEGAAVNNCELDVLGRRIRAVAMEAGKADRFARSKKAQGCRTALIEVERDNLFTLNLDNVQPGDLVVVRLSYCEALRQQGDRLRLRIPVCPGQRYVSSRHDVPDAGRLNPPRIDADHPEAASFSLRGEISGWDVDLGSLLSPTHPVFARQSEDKVQVSMADDQSVPDRDFILEWQPACGPEQQSRAWGFERERKPLGMKIPLRQTDNPALELLWHKGRIRELLGQNHPEEAVALALRHNLLCKGVSFVACDETE